MAAVAILRPNGQPLLAKVSMAAGLAVTFLAACAAPPRRGANEASPQKIAEQPPSPAQASAPSIPSTATLTLVAVGDMRLDGPVGTAAKSGGPGAPTAGVKKWLQGDILFGNLECSVTQRGSAAVKKWTFRSPPRNMRILSKAGFTIVNLANNHTMDYGAEGLSDTIEAVERAGLWHIGAGVNLEEARRWFLIERNGLRIAFIGLTSTIPEFIWAGKEKPGVAFADLARLPAWFKEAKENSDLLIVSFHGGTELDDHPNEVQRAFVHAAVDAGADIVIGHHPHVIQPAEVYKGKPILYSIGNFLFVSPSPATRWSAIVRIHLTKSGVTSIEFVPVDTQKGAGRILPAGAEGEKAVREALDRQGALSQHPRLLMVRTN